MTDEKRKCRKCGDYAQLMIEWEEEEDVLKCACTVCGYIWWEDPDDKKADRKAHELEAERIKELTGNQDWDPREV